MELGDGESYEGMKRKEITSQKGNDIIIPFFTLWEKVTKGGSPKITTRKSTSWK